MLACSRTDNTTGQQDAATPSATSATVTDSVAVTPDTMATHKALIDSLNSVPAYQELTRLAKEESKDFPKELMPGLTLVDNYLEGNDFFYMYIINEQKMSFGEIASQRADLRSSMAESIKNSTHEKGNPMAHFVKLCVDNGVRVNYLFKGAQSRRDLIITFTPEQLRQLSE